MKPSPYFMLAMYVLGLLALVAAMSGCAGLNASGVLTITYNTPATTSAILTPGK